MNTKGFSDFYGKTKLPGLKTKKPKKSLPGISKYSLKNKLEEVSRRKKLKISSSKVKFK